MNNQDQSNYSSHDIVPPHNYSLEEYLRLRDAFNSEKNKLPQFNEEKSIGFFLFTAKYVLPTILLCVILRPIFHAIGVAGSTVFIFAAIVYLVYKLPKISRALRKQEAIDIAERDNADYQAFMKERDKQLRSNKRKRST